MIIDEKGEWFTWVDIGTYQVAIQCEFNLSISLWHLDVSCSILFMMYIFLVCFFFFLYL